MYTRCLDRQMRSVRVAPSGRAAAGTHTELHTSSQLKTYVFAFSTEHALRHVPASVERAPAMIYARAGVINTAVRIRSSREYAHSPRTGLLCVCVLLCALPVQYTPLAASRSDADSAAERSPVARSLRIQYNAMIYARTQMRSNATPRAADETTSATRATGPDTGASSRGMPSSVSALRLRVGRKRVRRRFREANLSNGSHNIQIGLVIYVCRRPCCCCCRFRRLCST